MKRDLHIIVTGGRDYADRAAVYAALDTLHARNGIAEVIQGGATGADALAVEWCAARGVPCTTLEAEWGKFGRAAGPYRNAKMVDRGADGVVAFPGGIGTRDCVRQAGKVGIPVWHPVKSGQAELFAAPAKSAGAGAFRR